MVRGRRVRTVVACNRIDDCCSPNPKRKDQGLMLNGKNLTHFFQTAGDINDAESKLSQSKQLLIDADNNVKEEKTSSRRKSPPKKLNIIKGGVPVENGITNKDNSETPLNKQLKKPQTVFSPPTPHRIQLCSDSDEATNTDELAQPEKPPQPKAKKRLNVLQNGDSGSHKLTEYFPVRRSVRKTKKTVLEEKQRSLENVLRLDIEEGLIVQNFNGKGRGVVAAKPFEKGDFVVEYSGDLIDTLEAKKREQIYAQDQSAGCYMYYFKYKNQQYCIDATAESGRLGRLVNHSRNGNLLTRTVCVDGRPRLVLIAKTHIKEGDEITYDYGDRSKESLQHHPWLAY